MSNQEDKVLKTLKQNPLLSQLEIADLIGISRVALAAHVNRLMKKGKILGRGYVFPSEEQWLVIGGANLDYQGLTFSDFLPSDSNPGSISEMPGGVARNIAENLSRLGQKTSLITVLGVDAAGDFLIDHCKSLGIDTDHIFRIKKKTTSRYISLCDSNGLMQAAIADMKIMEQLDNTTLSQKAPLFSSSSNVIIDCNIPESGLGEIFKHCQHANIYVDAVSAAKVLRIQNHLSQIDTLKLNLAEAHALLSAHINDKNINDLSNTEVAKAINSLGVDQVLLSLGSQGVIFSSPDTTKLFEGKKIAVVSDVGAGDALFSGFIFAETQNQNTDRKMAFAIGCAALTLSHPAPNHPNLSTHAIEALL